MSDAMTMDELLAHANEEFRRKNLPPDEPWTPPDWAPKDAGSVLLRDGDWVTVKDYILSTKEPTVAVVHLCGGGEWVPKSNPPQLLPSGVCDTCGAEAPATVKGFTNLLKWDR